MINDVQRLRFVDFTSLKLPRLNYAEQTEISGKRVDQATACAIHYGLNPGMVIRFLMGEYVGEIRYSAAILAEVSLYINKEDSEHINALSTKDARPIFISRKNMKTSILLFGKGNNILSSCIPKPPQK